MSRTQSDVKLFFLGKRKYVQAPIQLEFALKEIQREHRLESLSDIFVHRYKQLQEVDGPLEILPESQTGPYDSLCSNVSVSISEKHMEYNLIAVPGKIDRFPEISYRQKGYRQHSNVEVSANLLGVNDFWEVLNEAVQLTKVFHVEKYNRDVHYRFIVGGFEQLRYEVFNDDSIELSCQIMRHIIHENNIYNLVRISVESDAKRFSFFIPFIGKKL